MLFCSRALWPPLRIRRSPRAFKLEPISLPYELWCEIFRMLDTATLVAVSRVSRGFNGHAIPIFLARHGMLAADIHAGTLNVPRREDIFPVLQTAFFLPAVRTVNCSVFGSRRFQIIYHLARFLSQQTTLEEVRLRFWGSDPFTGLGPKQKKIPRRTVQREICRLLNCITPTGKTLVVAPDRLLFSGSVRGDPWGIVRQVAAPPRGIRAKVRNAVAIKGWKRAQGDLVLHTVGEVYGTTCRGSFVLDSLRAVHVKYSPSPDKWALVVLNATYVQCLNLTSALSAADWSHLLPLLSLPDLEELNMGREAVYGGTPELHDIGVAELDEFLIRHPTTERLEYLPQLPPQAVPRSELSLGSFYLLTHLTTTPAHFIHLHHAPNSFPVLVQLILFSPASIQEARAGAEFMVVLSSLAGTDQVQTPGLQLHFPGVWIAPPAAGLTIRCVSSLLILGEVNRDVDALTEFISPFEAGLKWVEFQPTSRRTFADMRLVDELRRKVVWLEDVSCVRVESGRRVQSMPHPKSRATVSITYSDE
ncbi:hypothetical protein C8R45DRAFT_1005505 [Mycena sanguinolenta]|nr:hypothetical protein C8R45DRAFT_1005505 [Mycena sanguinolenta]